jgi:hypothetical protein
MIVVVKITLLLYLHALYGARSWLVNEGESTKGKPESSRGSRGRTQRFGVDGFIGGVTKR